jgi:hypothetical protein
VRRRVVFDALAVRRLFGLTGFLTGPLLADLLVGFRVRAPADLRARRFFRVMTRSASDAAAPPTAPAAVTAASLATSIPELAISIPDLATSTTAFVVVATTPSFSFSMITPFGLSPSFGRYIRITLTDSKNAS